MQPYFHWINEPAEWRRDADGLTVVTNNIGSVLTLTHSDWATGLFPGDPRTFWLRLTRKGDALRLQYSTDGEHWPLLRLGYFPPGPVKAGVMCCSPERGGLAVAFQDIQLSPPLDKALHDLS
ncbi:MAG: DUF1349 domain-containing protein [Klebsiella pneumoniae]|nr:DUF1349 domain-containing protein [Klebsiella pneumoniae]